MRRTLEIAALVGSLAWAACSSAPIAPAVPTAAGNDFVQSLDSSGAGKIKHVIWVVQENRSFNDMFEGYPGAKTVSEGKESSGDTIALQPISLKTVYEIDHSANAMFHACNGKGKLPGRSAA